MMTSVPRVSLSISDSLRLNHNVEVWLLSSDLKRVRLVKTSYLKKITLVITCQNKMFIFYYVIHNKYIHIYTCIDTML